MMANEENLVPFKEGFDERRNLKGNLGSQWSKTIIRKYLDKTIKKNNLDEQEEELPVGDHIIIATLKKALSGDTKALKELLDRLEGTPVQTVNQTVSTEKHKPVNEWVDTPPDNETEQ